MDRKASISSRQVFKASAHAKIAESAKIAKEIQVHGFLCDLCVLCDLCAICTLQGYHLIMRVRLICTVLTFVFTTATFAEIVTIATYNVEHFHDSFDAPAMRAWATTQPNAEELKEIVSEEKRQDDEDNWEVAQVISDSDFNPDILVLQECCGQKELDHFNKRWLRDMFETVIVLPSNTTREQHLGIMLKKGFKVIERRDQYHLEPDPETNARGGRLFARGPAFCLVETPGGYRFWVGTTHQKSKADNSVEVAKWRNREAVRTHEIIKELEKSGPTDVILLGDMNDEIGFQEFEKEGGGDTIANMIGAPENGLILATQPLADAGKISFGGYWNPRNRSLVDHVIITKSLANQVESIGVFNAPLARVASDHYPVFVKIRSDGVATTQPTTGPTTERASADTHDADSPTQPD
jgi:endonuclease/exonuclease/phosphatase family metal-dependent hydrolase